MYHPGEEHRRTDREPAAAVKNEVANAFLASKQKQTENAASTDRGDAISVPVAAHSVTASSRGWTRTSDSVVNSHLLYQLSYAGLRRGTKPGLQTPAPG